MNGLTIGKLAKKAGVTNDTVRFYERCGLIDPVGRFFEIEFRKLF